MAETTPIRKYPIMMPKNSLSAYDAFFPNGVAYTASIAAAPAAVPSTACGISAMFAPVPDIEEPYVTAACENAPTINPSNAEYPNASGAEIGALRAMTMPTIIATISAPKYSQNCPARKIQPGMAATMTTIRHAAVFPKTSGRVSLSVSTTLLDSVEVAELSMALLDTAGNLSRYDVHDCAGNGAVWPICGTFGAKL